LETLSVRSQAPGPARVHLRIEAVSADVREHRNRDGQCTPENRESMGALAGASLLASLSSEADAGSSGSEHHRDASGFESRLILSDRWQLTIHSKLEMKLLISSALVGSVRAWSLTSLLGIFLFQPGPLAAEPVAVRYREGSVHGFLALRTLEGKILAAGDLTQTVRGNRVVSRLVFRFKDGSVDDETAVFSQQRNFRLITDRHIQKGPSFPHPTDVSINSSTGQVTVRYTDNGHEKVETERLDLPPDLANGIILNISSVRHVSEQIQLVGVMA
jgi:hypothetical protein